MPRWLVDRRQEVLRADAALDRRPRRGGRWRRSPGRSRCRRRPRASSWPAASGRGRAGPCPPPRSPRRRRCWRRSEIRGVRPNSPVTTTSTRRSSPRGVDVLDQGRRPPGRRTGRGTCRASKTWWLTAWSSQLATRPHSGPSSVVVTISTPPRPAGGPAGTAGPTGCGRSGRGPSGSRGPGRTPAPPRGWSAGRAPGPRSGPSPRSRRSGRASRRRSSNDRRRPTRSPQPVGLRAGRPGRCSGTRKSGRSGRPVTANGAYDVAEVGRAGDGEVVVADDRVDADVVRAASAAGRDRR